MSREIARKWLELNVLQTALKASVDGRIEQGLLKDARESVKSFIVSGSIEAGHNELTDLGSKAVMRCIVYAYAVRIFEQKGALCGPLARLLEWFVRQTDAETQRDFWDVLLFSRQYNASKLSVADVTNGKYKRQEEKRKEQADLGILLELLSISQSMGQEDDAIVGLIEMALYEMRTYLTQSGSSSASRGHGGVHRALQQVACSPELFTLFLSPLVVKTMSRGQTPPEQCLEISVEEMTELTWSDGRYDRGRHCTIGPRKRPDALIVDTLKSLPSRRDVAELISNLSDVYDSPSDFAKSQLCNKILKVIFCSDNVMMFDALCSTLQTTKRKNDALVLDILVCLFESSFLFGDLPALTMAHFSNLVSFCLRSIGQSIPQAAAETCFRSVTQFQPQTKKEKEWRFERLSLLRFFFAEDVALTLVTSLDADMFHSLGGLFLFLHRDPDLARLKEEAEKLSSTLKSLSHYCHYADRINVFPCLLHLAQENGGNFCVPLQNSCSLDMITKWTRRPRVDEVRMLVDLYLCHDDKEGTWLRSALSWLMESANGQQALQDAAIGESTWAEVRDRLLGLMNDVREQNIDSLLCLTRLVYLLLNLHPEIVVPTLKLVAHGIVHFEMPDDEFDLLMRAMTADLHRSDTVLKKMLSAAFDASLSEASLSDITFFDMLIAFVERQPAEDKGSLCRVIRQLLHKVFDLMEKDESEIQMGSLKKLVHLAIEGRTESGTEAETAVDSSQDIHMRPFFSATFPEGKTVQVDTASLDDVKKMANVFYRRQLNLASASLREEILLPPAEMKGTVESADDCSSKNATSLIRTPTTEENLQMIEEVVEYDRPVLLYGASGVGKTATLRELAERKGVNLVRLNMSSNLTPEDFLAKISFDLRGQIVLDVQPFARSFEKGDWVLLDEMNLAEESALKVVVDAVENGEIVLCDQSSALTPPRILKKHPNFRLFATQNPWQAGKRERMSHAFFSHFSVMHFKELPKEEWDLIVQSTLHRRFESAEMDLIRAVAGKMTDFHCSVREAIQTKCCETGSHTVITNRELLIWTAMISTAEQLPRTDEELGDYAWLIYGSRFRKDGQQLVRDILKERGLSVGQQNASSSTPISSFERMMQAYGALRSNSSQGHGFEAETFWRRYFPGKASLDENIKETVERCMSTHGDVSQAILEPDFMQRHGVYTSFSEFWLVKWITDAQQRGRFRGDSPEALGQLGAEIYCSAFRNNVARTIVLEIFAAKWNIDRSSVDSRSSVVPEMPVALNDQTCALLTVLVSALQSEQPILIEGCAGSGKTCLAKTIAFLLRSRYEQVTLTVESEPSVMLGEHLPRENSRQNVSVEWRDGPLTRSFKEGGVCIVDNIGQAEAVLQERINPVLESPKILCLSEKGETKIQHCRVLNDGTLSKVPGPASGFQFIATYTPKGVASRGYDSSSNALTAAFANRFLTVHVDDPARLSDSAFSSVLHSMLQCSLRDEHHRQHIEDICAYCVRIQGLLDAQRGGRSNFRHFVTFLDIVTNLMVQCPQTDAKDCLHCALMAAFVFRIKDPQQRNELMDHMGCSSDVLSTLQLDRSVEVDPELVLTPSRRSYADAVLLGVCTNKPVLLEGKPAVGKTALISGLRVFRGRCNRVNILSNSDTTTLQDYFGTWMPEKAGFRYSKGVLVQAMEKGEWFVADEFNLAPLSVAAALMPFLEGSRVVQIPDTGMTINVHPEFRFFATQNPFSGGGDGRKLLPITVRNRFLEVDVDDFPPEEFAEIIYKRFQKEEYQDIVSETDAEHLSSLYFASSGIFRLTMRDLIKMVRRFKLLQAENAEGTTSWAAVVMSLLYPLVSTEDEKLQLLSLISKAFGEEAGGTARSCMEMQIQETSHELLFFQGPLRVSFSGYQLKRSRLWKHGNAEKFPPKIFQDKLVELAFTMKANEPVLLYGESSFKTELIRTWLEISQMTDRAQIVHLTSDSEATELIGQVHLASTVEVLEMLLSVGNFILHEIETELTTSDKSENREYNIRRIDCSSDLSRRINVLKELFKGKPEIPTDQRSTVNVGNTQSASFDKDESKEDSPAIEDQGSDNGSDSGTEWGGSNNEDGSPVQRAEELMDENKEDSPAIEDQGSDNGSDSGTEWGGSDDEDGSPVQRAEESMDAVGSFSGDRHPDAEAELEISEARERVEEPEYKAFNSVRETVRQIVDLLRAVFDEPLPVALEREVHRMNQLCTFLSAASQTASQGCFVFRDGPFVNAINLKHICVLEDYDRCPQSVTERLNSALEVDPTFSIPEDASLSGIGAVTLDIPQRGYAFIATANVESSTKKPRLSEATKSRITRIHIPAYSNADIMSIVDAKLFCEMKDDYPNAARQLMDAIQAIQTASMEETHENPCADFRRILRWVSFVTHHPKEIMEFKRIILLGAKYLYLFGLSTEKQKNILLNYFGDEVKALDKALDELKATEGDSTSSLPIKIKDRRDKGDRLARLDGVGLTVKIIPCQTEEGNTWRPSLQSTPTVVDNTARIFASICTKTPLLLEGPPGIGKTAVVVEVAGHLGTCVERINCSSDTTTEQLFGSEVPQYKSNRRTFEWTDGKLVKAINEGRWILLDEINLLSPQVLESLVPLLNGSAVEHGMAIPGQPGAKKFTVKDVHIFATMNPAAEGGGRTKISRSIRNLFTSVELDPQNDEELFQILTKLFEDRIRQDLIRQDVRECSIQQVFAVYTSVQSLVDMGEIKGASGRQRFNLRDLVAVRDIVAGNIRDQLSHYEIVATDSSREELSDERKAVVMDAVLRNALQLVFKHRFEDQAAQERIQEAIDQGIEPPKLQVDEANNTSIDTSVSNLVRIGSVYLNKNPSRASSGFLVHTKETVEQLELLAAASQSTRTVLLEGPTCSRKTSLVKELAALTGRPLLLLSLHRECDVSDLIGQWLPARTDALHGEVLRDLLYLRDRIIRTGLALCEDIPKDKQTAFYRAIKKARGSSDPPQEGSSDKQTYRFSLEISRGLVQGLKDTVNFLESIDEEGSTLSFAEELQVLSDKLVPLMDDTDKTVVFRFVTSDLVKALRSGTFILFDNINAAPPEVIERMLSLFEEEPFLNLYEHSEGEKLSRQCGIHPDTRLFATADLRRINTYKLSNPLLNRMIKIWLPEVDAGVSEATTFEPLEKHEVVEIVSEKFASHAGGDMAAQFLCFVHARVKQLAKSGQITIAKDSSISFRTLLEASSLVSSLLRSDQPVFNAVVWGAWRVYASLMEEEADWVKLKEVIGSACEATAEVPPSKFYATRQSRDAVKPFLAESERIRLIFASVVHVSLKILFGCIMKIPDMEAFERLVLHFLNRIAVRLYPQDESIIRKLAEEVPKGARNKDALKHHCDRIGCLSLTDFFKAVTDSEMQRLDFVCQHPQKLMSLCEQLIANSSYTDWQYRRFMIQDMADVLQELADLLEAVSAQRVMPSDVKKIIDVVRHWRSVGNLSVCFAPLEDVSFAACYKKLLQAQRDCSDPAVSYNLEKLLSEKVSASDMKLRNVIVNLLKCDGHSAEERRRMALQIAMTSLRWRTTLMVDERLLTIQRVPASAGYLLDLQRLLCKAKIIAELQHLVDKAMEVFKSSRKGQGFWKHAVDLGKTIFSFGGQSSQHPSEGSETEDYPPDEEKVDAYTIPDVAPYIEQLDALAQREDTVFLFSDEWTATVESHSKILNDLYARRETEGEPLNLDTVFPALLGSRMKDQSQDVCTNELALIWLGVCFSEWQKPIPCRIVLCTEENLVFDPFNSTESAISAVILCAQLSDEQRIAALASLVVFEKLPSDAGNETSVNVKPYCCGPPELSQVTWLKKWIKMHTEYRTDLSDVQRLPSTKTNVGPVSRLGSGLIAFLDTLQSYGQNQSTPDNTVSSDTLHTWKALMEKVKEPSRRQDFSQAPLLYHGVLKLDSVLFRQQYGNIEDEADISSVEHLFSKQFVAWIEAEIRKSMAKIKTEATQPSQRESASIAFSFLEQFKELKEFPSEDLVSKGYELEHAIQAVHGDLLFVLKCIRPVLRLREFLVEYSLGHLDTADPDLWTKCNAVTAFVSGSIAYFNGFLIVEKDTIKLDRKKSPQEFIDWHDSFNDLVDQLCISTSFLQAINLHEIFLRLKDLYVDLLQTEDPKKTLSEGLRATTDASGSLITLSSGKGSDDDRSSVAVSDLRVDFEHLWLEARKDTDKAVMDEVAKALGPLTRRSVRISKALLVQYQSRFNTLKAELEQTKKKNAQHPPLLSKECEIFERNRSICLQNCDFSCISTDASPENHLVENPLVDIFGRIASLTDQAERSMKTLKWMAKSTAFHARLQKSMDVLRSYDFENDDLSKKKDVLEELSDLGIFPGALSIRMKFRAFTSEICDHLIQEAAVELMNVKADFLLKEQNEMLHPNKTREIENAVAAITSLCTEDNCSMLMAHPVFDALRTHSMDLSACLDESAVMANVASSFVSPGLSMEDITVLFCGDFKKAQRILMDLTDERDLYFPADDPKQKMRQRGRLVSYCYQRDAKVIHVFGGITETVGKAVASFLESDWRSKLASESGDAYKESVKEAVISLQFIALPVLMTRQNFSFLSTLLELSNSVEEQRTATELKMGYENVKNELKAAQDKFEQVRKREICDPVFDSDFFADKPVDEHCTEIILSNNNQ